VLTFTVKTGTNKQELVLNAMKDVLNGKVSVSKLSNIAHNGTIRETAPHVKPDMEILNRNPSTVHAPNSKLLLKIPKLNKPKPIKLRLNLQKDKPKLRQNNHPLQIRAHLWAHKISSLNFHWLIFTASVTQKTENASTVSMGITLISTLLAKSCLRIVLLQMRWENAQHA
jgi:hypothetical protein